MSIQKILLLTSVAALATACAPSGYEIAGTAENVADGDSVFLVDATTHAVLDTALITSGAFTFKGSCDTTKFATVKIEKVTDGSAAVCPFYLENGKISMFVASKAEDNRVTGTSANDAEAALNAHIAKVIATLDSLEQLAQDTTLAATVRDAYNQQADSVYDNDYVGAIKASAKKNINLLVGIHQLRKVAYAVELPELDSLVSLVPVRYHADGIYTKLAERVERMKQVDLGKPFIDFAMPSIEGDTIRLSSLMEGHKVVMIDFWASWCGPCRREMPNIVKAYADFKDRGLQIIGVSQDSDDEAWRNAVTDLGMTWPQLSPLKGWENEAVKIYAINAIPNTVVIKDGVIVAHQLTGEELIAKLEELLSE